MKVIKLSMINSTANIFPDFVNAVGNVMGVTDALFAGIFLAGVITLTIFFIIEIANRGANHMAGISVCLVCTIMFTAMGWYPEWTGGAIALGWALMIAWMFSKAGG